MSIESRSWAWSLEPLRPAVKLTLLAIADVADEDGRCYCSQRRLIHKTYQSEGTIKRILRELEHLGLIERFARYADNGARIPDGFALQLGVTNAELAPRVEALKAASEGEGSKVDGGEGVRIEPPPRSHSYDSSPESLVDPPNKPDSNRTSPLPPSLPVQARKKAADQGKPSGEVVPKVSTPTQATRFYPEHSSEGAAIRVIAGLRGESNVPGHWRGQDSTTRRLGYWVPFEMTPRLIGLGRAVIDNRIRFSQWHEFAQGSQEAGAWRALFKSIGLKPPATIRAPWPFPPRVDGTLSDIQESTGPPPKPRPLTEEEARSFGGI